MCLFVDDKTFENIFYLKAVISSSNFKLRFKSTIKLNREYKYLKNFHFAEFAIIWLQTSDAGLMRQP